MEKSKLRINVKERAFRVVKYTLDSIGKGLLRLFKNNPKAIDLFKRINGRVNTLLLSIPHREVSGANSVYEEFSGDIGINVAGYITAESGIGEAARATIRALETVGLPFALNNLTSISREGDYTYSNFTRNNPYAINIIHTAIEHIPLFYLEQGGEYFDNKYNIGVWYWELSLLPREWSDRYRYFHEIWVASAFCQESIAEISPIPVVKIPPSVSVGDIAHVDRDHFGLSKDSFVFFFMFSFFSVFERKNPLAIIEAFKLAFRPDEDVVLLLKLSNSEVNPGAKASIIEAAKGLKVKLIDTSLYKNEVNALMSLIDCYVSLHRSEGFSLPLAEAMYLKKPTIATAYSGNTDFMNVNNSFLVKYKMIEIEKDLGPYKKGNAWADPDISHAAELMKKVRDERIDAQKLGEQASLCIDQMFNPHVTGQKILRRIEYITQVKGLGKYK
jgi:glycosyltransferase involved in cell wall biosynthesis